MHQCDFDSLARTVCDAIDILQENLHFVIKNEINEKVFKYQSTIASLEYFLEMIPVPQKKRPILFKPTRCTTSPTTPSPKQSKGTEVVKKSTEILSIDENVKVEIESKNKKKLVFSKSLITRIIKFIFIFSVNNKKKEKSIVELEKKIFFRDVQVNLYNFSLVNSDWNEVSNSFLWLNPNLSSTKDLSKLVYCSVLSGIRMQQQNAKFDKSEFSSMQTNPTSIDKCDLKIITDNNNLATIIKKKYNFKKNLNLVFNLKRSNLGLYLKRLNLIETKIDYQNRNFLKNLCSSFPHIQVLIWSSNPILESTLFEIFKNCKDLKKLSLSGPIISKKQLKNSEACTADDAEYLEVVQQGLARLTHLEILDFEDDITDSTESPTKVCSPSSFLPTPTESMGNFKVPSSNKQTINEEIYFGSKSSKGKSVSLDQLSGKSLTSNSKVKKLANEKLKEINKIISISPTLLQPSAVQPETNLSGEKQIVRDLPRLLKKSFVGVLEHLSLSGNSTSDLVVSIVRLSNGLKHALLNDCNNLTDRAAILLAANCGFTLTKISFKNCNLISDESIYEIRQYCHKLQYLDLTRTSITDKALEILADDLGEEDNNWEGLKGLYLEQTSICSDGGVKLDQYIKSFGCKLVDLNLLNCNFSLSKSESEAIFNTFNSFSDFSNFERFDCRNTFNLSSDYNGTRNSKVGKTSVSSNLVTKNGNGLEDEITKFVLNFVNLNTFNLGVLGVETTPFIEELYVKFPNEGMFQIIWIK